MDERKIHLEIAQAYRKLASLHEMLATGGEDAPRPRRIMDIQERIIKHLEGGWATTAMIAEALYDPNYGLTKDHFLRRVTVKVSAMYKDAILKKWTRPDKTTVWSVNELWQNKQTGGTASTPSST